MTRRGARRRSVAVGALALAAATMPAVAGRPWWVLAGGLVLCLLASAIAVEDLARMLIPDGLTAAIGVVAALLFLAQGGGWIDLAGLALAALATGGGLWLASNAYARLRGRDGIGFGDVKLIGASALLVGPWGVGLQVLLASVAAIVFLGIRSLRRGRRLRATSRVPFGAFLAPALVIVWAWFPMPS